MSGTPFSFTLETCERHYHPPVTPIVWLGPVYDAIGTTEALVFASASSESAHYFPRSQPNLRYVLHPSLSISLPLTLGGLKFAVVDAISNICLNFVRLRF